MDAGLFWYNAAWNDQENCGGGEDMEDFTIIKADGNAVSCRKEIPLDPKGIVIAIHGFTSNKDCSTYRLLMHRMPAAGYGVIGIELPGHGTGKSLQETLRIEGCLNSIAAAEQYAAEHYPGKSLFYFASSFGAFVTGIYISKRPHLGKKAFFRSAAVNMPSLFVKKELTESDRKMLRALKEKGYFETGFDLGKPVRITREMYHDLETTDLFSIFDASRYGDNSVMMVHGEKDTVIDPLVAKMFANRFGIPIMIMKEEGHSLSDHPETPDRVADLAIDFFNSAM